MYGQRGIGVCPLEKKKKRRCVHIDVVQLKFKRPSTRRHSDGIRHGESCGPACPLQPAAGICERAPKQGTVTKPQQQRRHFTPRFTQLG